MKISTKTESGLARVNRLQRESQAEECMACGRVPAAIHWRQDDKNLRVCRRARHLEVVKLVGGELLPEMQARVREFDER